VRPVLALLVAGVVATSGASAGTDARRQADPLTGIQELLDRRTEAMLAGDRDAFLETIDPADDRFAARQRFLFDGFQALGLAEYRLELTDRYWPELTTRKETAEHGLGARVLHVEERYRLRGFDPQPVVEDLFLTFVPRGETWVIASDDDLADLALKTARKLWEFGPIDTQRSEHFLYVSPPDLRPAGPPILSSAEAALEELDEMWPLDWPRRVVLLAPSSTQQLRRILQATFDLDVFVAFAYSSVDRAQDYRLAGHRVIFNWDNFSRYSAQVQQSILVHELLHVATREVTGPLVPTFLEEGLAEWVSDGNTDQLEPRVDSGTFDRELPRDFEFITGPGVEILLSYDESYTATLYAVRRYGVDAVVRMYRHVGAVRLEPGTPFHHVDRAMRKAFGTDLETFQQGWAGWVEDQL
jgi:hypothetical protein